MAAPESRRFKVDIVKFEENQKSIPWAMIEPYRGKHIAWNAEGTRIVASGETYEALEERLAALGIPGDEVVFHYIPRPDESI